MGRFEKKIQQKLNAEKPQFEKWYGRNREKFAEFDASAAEERKRPAVAVKKRPAFFPQFATICVAVLCILSVCFIPFNGIDRPSDELYGDGEIYSSTLTENEKQSLWVNYPFLENLQNTMDNCSRLIENDKLLAVTFKGELDSIFDYYFIKCEIVFDERYNFLEKNLYINLKSSAIVQNKEIKYEMITKTVEGLFNYLIIVQDGENTMYIDIKSFDETVLDFLNMAFGPKESLKTLVEKV